MSRVSDRPLRKVTLNLYDEDVRTLERSIGYGWSETVRDQVHAFVRTKLQSQPRSLLKETFNTKDPSNV